MFMGISQVIENHTRQNGLMREFMFNYYKPIVKKEVDLCKATPSNRILCVGGGYFPCTAILFHRFSGATVTVIDNDKKAIRAATEVVHQLGLSHKVIVKYSDGLDISAEDFDIVHIAMQISPKEKVFKHIYSTMEKKSKILVRTPKKHLERGYQPFRNICQISNSVVQPRFSNIERSLLYVR